MNNSNSMGLGLQNNSMSMMPPMNFNMFGMNKTAPSNNNFIPGSPAHALAFHAKGPDNEIKLFVGGLAF